MEHALRAVSRRAAFPAVFTLLCVVALLPLGASRILPLSDEPNHLSVAYILHNIGDPGARLRELYDVSIPAVPYVGYYLLVHLVAFVVGVELAHKVVLAAYVLSLPLAALWWTRRTGREPWLSILAFPLAYSFSWSIGFHPFNVGLALFLLAGAAIDAFLERPSARMGALVAALALASDFGHPLAIVALYAAIPVLVLAHRPPLRRLGVLALLVAPGALVFAWQVLIPKIAWSMPRPGTKSGFLGTWVGTGEMLKSFPQYALDSVSGPVDMWAFGALAATLVLLLIAGVVGRERGSPRARLGEFVLRYRAALLALTMLALYLIVPMHLQRPHSWWFVSGRYAPLVCFFAFLVPWVELRGRRMLAMAPALAAALILPLHIASKYATFGEHVRPFVRMVARAERGSEVLFLRMGARTDSTVNVPMWNHFGAWVQILHGGFSNAGWFDAPTIVRAKKRLPSPPYNQHERYDHRLHAEPYRYIIVFREAHPLYPANSMDFRVIDREGEWTMYARVEQTP